MELAARKNGGISMEMENMAYENETLSPDAIRLTQYDINHLTVHQAAREGDVAIIERLMEKYSTSQQKKKRLNSRDDSKLTPLHYAARYNHYHMLQYLLKNGANPNVKAEDGATALHFLAKYKKKRITVEAADNQDSSDSEEEELPPEETFSCLKLLVENGAQVNAKDTMGLTPLHHACTRGNTKAVKELMTCAGIGLEMADNQGMTALHLACLYNKRSIVRTLIDAGANMRARDKDQTTPLLLACAEGGLRIAELLLEKAEEFAKNLPGDEVSPKEKDQNYASVGAGGAAELLKDTDGEKNLPLHLSIENGHLELVEFCISKSTEAGIGSMVGIRRSREETCLHLAVLSNNIDIVQLLMRHGADVNARNSSMASPLFVAAQFNAHAIVKYLLEHGANVDMKNNDFFTPLLMASRHGHLETITHLLDHHADITETDKDDKTCIIWAAEEDRTDALGLLLQTQKGRALIEERDRYNNTALHMASSKGHVNAVKFLLQYRAPADIKNDDDRTTLHMAALNGNDLIIPELIARDRTILNAGDEDANAALHLAAMGGNVKCVEILIQLGANIELRNAKQWTPLDSAAAYGWEKPARVLLEAGAAVQPRGKIKVSPLHLACKNGHLEMVTLLLAWRADVTFRSADGRNSLDFAIDSNQKDCVVALLKHATWKDSLRNAVVNPVNGRMSTPMRKLIKKMPDIAELVYNQCITDNGKKPEDDNYKITLLYEFLDDMYASSAWNDYASVDGPRKESNDATDDAMYAGRPSVAKVVTKDQKSVYDDNGYLTPEAKTYSMDSDELQKNHPLKIMVSSKREELLLHPVVTGLLNYKWRRFGRFIYYITLLLFVVYLILLNVYMMTLPRPYEIDWALVVYSRNYLINNDTVGMEALISAGLNPEDQTLHCYYYRTELIGAQDNLYAAGCQTLSSSYTGMKWTIFAFSAFNLLREIFQLINQRLRYVTEFTNFVEVSLYVLTLLTTINYPGYYVDPVTYQTDDADLIENATDVLMNFQDDTGMRQEWQSEVGAFAIFLAWMGLLLFIQKIPYLGIFVVMFTDILKTFAQFFFVFVFFILGFAFAFNILLGNQYVFATWYDSMIKTTVMMIGELDYGTIFYGYKEDPESYFANIYTKSVSYVLFSIFLIVMTIIIMNLLVGLAVGDIIEVQEHATLERLGMTVDLALDVEFTLPEFLRKRVCVRKQTIEVNKYRKANALKKFFLEDSDLTVENITKSLNREKGEQDEMRESLDRVLTGLGRLRNRLTDVIGEQSEVKMGIFGIRTQIRESRAESKTSAKALQESVSLTREMLGGQLGKTHEGLAQVAQTESNATRTKVDNAQTQITALQGELADTRNMITEVRQGLEERMDKMHRELMERKGKELEEGLEQCNNRIEQTRNEVLQSLEEMKMILVKEKYMTSV